MKLSAYCSAQLLLGACFLGGIHVNATTTPKCNADNCLRALFPTNSPAQLSTASAFCATYTLSTHTASTGFPSRASAACGSSPSRFSSACLCQPKPTTTAPTSTTTNPTTTPTTTVPTTTVPTTTVPTTTIPTTTTTTSSACPGDNGIIKNGGFECGIAPWQPAATPGTGFLISSPGYNSNNAFEVDQISVASNNGLEQASVNQDVTTTPGFTYLLTFRSYFNRGDAGFIGVKIDQFPVYTVDASDFNGPLVWNYNSITFSAAKAITNIRIEFLFGAQGSVDKIDNVAINPFVG